MPQLKLSLYQLDKLIQKHLPSLYNIFQKAEISSELFAVQWFITLFAYDVSFHNLKVIWDLFFLKGWRLIFQFSLAILSALPSISPGIDPEILIFRIKNVLHSEPIMKLVKKALEINVTNEELEEIETQYELYDKLHSQSKELTEETKAEVSSNKDARNLNDSSDIITEPYHKADLGFKGTSKGAEINPMKKSLIHLKKPQHTTTKTEVKPIRDIILYKKTFNEHKPIKYEQLYKRSLVHSKNSIQDNRISRRYNKPIHY